MLACLRSPCFKRISYLVSRPLFVSSSSLVTPAITVSKSQEKQWFSGSNLVVAGISNTSSATNPSSFSDATNSSTSSYLSVRVYCPKHVADMLCEALLCFGASSTSMDELEDNDNTDEVCINSIFTECEDVGTCVSRAADSIGLKEMPSYEVMTGEQCDWVTKTQESFHPMEIIEGLWVVPELRSPPDMQATNIIINPGLAFGTGEHPTTKLCLLLLHNLVKGGELFLDYGTGSGILGIAALKLGASSSVGVDTDPQAITSARQNAILNNISPQEMQLFLAPNNTSSSIVEKECGNEEPENSKSLGFLAEKEKYDIVIANILLNPLLELADEIVSYARPGAVLGISGILFEQVPQIKEHYSQYLEGISVSVIDGWACVSGSKRLNR